MWEGGGRAEGAPWAGKSPALPAPVQPEVSSPPPPPPHPSILSSRPPRALPCSQDASSESETSAQLRVQSWGGLTSSSCVSVALQPQLLLDGGCRYTLETVGPQQRPAHFTGTWNAGAPFLLPTKLRRSGEKAARRLGLSIRTPLGTCYRANPSPP